MQYCDLVMKGGITSGIVYPNAVLALAKQFRFKSVGGTSAGAIAAAVTAAAALGDRRIANGHVAQHDAPGAGFAGLSEVSSQLSTAGFIRGLFRPARGAFAWSRSGISPRLRATTRARSIPRERSAFSPASPARASRMGGLESFGFDRVTTGRLPPDAARDVRKM